MEDALERLAPDVVVIESVAQRGAALPAIGLRSEDGEGEGSAERLGALAEDVVCDSVQVAHAVPS